MAIKEDEMTDRGKESLENKRMLYEKLVEFQGDMMEHLYDDYKKIFGHISKYLQCSCAVVLLCDENGVVRTELYDSSKHAHTEGKQLLNSLVAKILKIGNTMYTGEQIPEYVYEYMSQWGMKDFERITSFCGEVNHSMYTVILCHNSVVLKNMIPGMEKILVNNIRMCLENRIYHELISYESQHDLLTKLFNRRCYFRRCQEEYPLLASIGIFYFDVNDLKTVNDCYGHDAGDALLQKAAESLQCLMSDTVHAYRMGGDEFIVVAMNCTQNDMMQMLIRWEHELNNVNEKYGGDPCTIAVGSAFAKGSFEIEELCRLADKRMYQDKMQKKYNRMG